MMTALGFVLVGIGVALIFAIPHLVVHGIVIVVRHEHHVELEQSEEDEASLPVVVGPWVEDTDPVPH